MAKRNQTTKPAPSAAPAEQSQEEQAVDQANLDQEGDDHADESGNESAGTAPAAGDGTGDEASEEGEADTGAGSDSESSDEGVGKVDEEDTLADEEREQLAAALAAVTAPTAATTVAPVVNDIPAPAVLVAPVVADIPEAAPVAAPAERAASVSLPQTPIPVRVDVKTQQADIKLQLIQDRLTEYAAAMAPNAAISVADGKVQQLNLWKVIDQVLKLEGPEFIRAYSMLLDFVAEYRTAHFSDKYVYRFFGEVALSAEAKKNFNRLLHLLVATSDRATRRLGLDQVDLPRTLAGIRDTAIQQRIAEFYQI